MNDACGGGRPTEISDEKKVKCDEAIRCDRRIKVSDLAVDLKISYGSAHNIITELGYRKLCSRFVPKFLTPEMKEARLRSAVDNLALLE